MPSECNAMAEFFERLGHKIIYSPNATWYEVQPRALLSCPYYKLVEPKEEELEDLIQREKVWIIRYPTNLNNYGFLSTLAVNTNSNYDLSSQHQKARNQTRRALEQCVVEQIDFDYLLEHGLSLNIDTAQRQGRESQYADADYWKKYCQAAKTVNGVTVWGAFVEGKLASFLISIEVGDWAEWVVNHSATALRDRYPNNALAFTVGQHYLVKMKFAGICYGLGSLEHTPELNHFKERMGWTLKPIKQRLVYARSMRLVCSLAQEPILKLLQGISPKNYTVRKTAAMIRLYRQQTLDISSSEKGETR